MTFPRSERPSTRRLPSAASRQTKKVRRRAFFETLESRNLMATQVFANVPEAANYSLVYELNIANTANYSTGAVPYAVNNSGAINNQFDRVAYYLELDTDGAGPAPLQYVFVSADAFTSDLTKIGVPNLSSGATWQRNLGNMNVVSNVAGITTGTNLTTGNIEFWPTNYGNANVRTAAIGGAVPNANGATFDFGDQPTAGGYGSMQIHNYDLDGAGAGTAGQTLFAYNDWNNAGANSDLGIGNDPNTGRGSYQPDWTFAGTNGFGANQYQIKNLAVLVRQTAQDPTPKAPAAPPALVSYAGELAGYQLVYSKSLTTNTDLNTTAFTYDANNAHLIPNGSFDRVAYVMELNGGGFTNAYAVASFDAAGFATDAARIGIPYTGSGELYQQNVTNLNVASNVAGVVNGTGIATGNIEFWPNSYSQGNAAGVPGANGGTFDFGDTVSGTVPTNGHGSMQIHNYGAGQTVMAFNAWGAPNTYGLGIGNRASAGDPDWTFAANFASLTTKNIYVLVRPKAVTNTVSTSSVPAAVRANAPELADYRLVYEKGLPNAANYNPSATYNVDNAASIAAGSFDRMGYYLQLNNNYVATTFDAITTLPTRTGIPTFASGAVFQQNLTNLNVKSNVGSIVQGTGIATGNIEFWPNDYSTGVGAGVPNANGGTYDFGDTRSGGGAHGSMQIHNYDLDGGGAGTTGQVLFAYNNWNSGASNSLGIGTNPGTQPDWTFETNSPSYNTKNLYSLVRPTGAALTSAATLKRVGGVNQYLVDGAITVYSDTLPLVINGTNGNDTLTIDFSGGNPLPTGGLTFNGGGQTSATNGDTIVLTGGTTTAINHSFTNNSDGSITLTGALAGTINYTGLEPITDNLIVADRTFTFTGAAETIAITDSNGADNKTRIDSTLGEFVDFITPTNSLTIITNGGDTTNITAFDAAFNTPTITLQDSSGTTSTTNLLAAERLPDSVALTVNGNAALNLNGFAETIGSLAGTGTVTNSGAAATLTTGGTNASTTFSGAITGALALVKQGTGVFTLTGTNSYTGLTTVNAGVLRIGAVASSPGNVTVNSGGTFDVNGQNLNIAGRTVTLNGVGAAGQLGALVNTNGGAEGWVRDVVLTGNTTIGTSAAKLNIGNTLNGGGFTLTNNGTSEKNFRALNAVSNLPRMIAAQGLTRFENDQNWTGVLQVNAGATADTYIGAGTRTMSAALDLQGGTLTTGSGSATWTGAVTLTNTSLITAQNGVIALNGAIGGAGGYTKNGANVLTLAGAGSNYTGAVTVSAGTLNVTNTSGLGTASGLTEVQTGAQIDLNSAGGSYAEPFNISGTGTAGGGALRAVGGTYTLTGPLSLTTNAAAIGTDVLATSLTQQGQVNLNDGTLSVTGPGIVNVTGAIVDALGAPSVINNSAGFPSAAGLSLVQTAAVTANRLRLTTNAGSQLGSAWTTAKVHVGAGFSTDFALGFDGPTSGNGADGIAFSVQNTPEGNARTGAGEAGPGTRALTIGVNSYNGGSTTASIISVISNGVTIGTFTTSYDVSGRTNVPLRVDYKPGDLDVYFDINGDSVLQPTEIIFNSLNVTLVGAQAVDNAGDAWLGFSARTGGAAEFHYVNNWTFTTGGNNGGVTKNGTGVLNLSGANTYVGPTIINAGRVSAQNAAALGTSAGGTQIAGGAQLDLNFAGGTLAEAFTVAGSGLAGAGAIQAVGGAYTLNGSLTLSAAATLGTDLAASSLTQAGSVDLRDASLTTVGPGAVTINGAIGDSLTTASTVLNNAAGFPTAAGFNFVQNASLGTNRLQITSNAGSQIGAAWSTSKYHVGGGFTANFALGFDGPTTGNGADGLAFSIQNTPEGFARTGATEIGPNANALTIGINSYNGGSTTANIINVISNGVTLASYTTAYDVSGRTNVPLRVVYRPGDLDVYFDVNGDGTLQTNEVIFHNLNTTLSAANAIDANGDAWVGFSGRTGGATEFHFVNNFTLATGGNAAGVNVSGTGMTTLGGVNTYVGLTNVNSGVLAVTNTAALGAATAGTIVAPGATLQLNTAGTIAEPLTLAGTGAGAGALVNIAGNPTLTGALILSAPATIANSAAGSTLSLNGAIDLSGKDLTLAGAGDIAVGGIIAETGLYSAISVTNGFVNASNLNIIGGSAGYVNNRLRLTSNTNSQLGQAWSTTKQYVADGFTSEFTVDFSAPNNNGADGLAFIVQNTAAGATQNTAGEGGTGSNDLTISLNSWNGGGTESRLRIYQNGAQTHQSNYPGYDFSGAGTLLTRVIYQPGDLDVYFDLNRNGVIEPATELIFADVNVNLASLNAQDAGGYAWVGFGARTGGANENHDVLSWTFATGGTNAGLIKTGAGVTTLSAANTYTGVTSVNAGRLNVNGSLANGPAANDVVVAAGATLGGTGVVNGAVNVLGGAPGGHVSPGTSPGVLTTGGVTWAAGSSFDVELNGLTVGTQYDQLVVNGAVALGGATLNLSGSFAPSAATFNTFTLIANDGADAVTGAFAGLAEGAAISFNSGTLYISYKGGDGNDVTLTSQPFALGTSGADTVTLTATPSGYTYQLNADPVITITGTTTFNFAGQAADDLLIVQLAAASVLPNIVYSGGGQDFTSRAPIALGDVLRVIGTGGETATYRGDGVVNAGLDNDGTVAITGQGTIAFSQLEPVDLQSMATANVNFANGADIVAIADGLDTTATNPALVISGTSGGVPFEQVHLRNNTNVVLHTVTGGSDGNDTVTINSGVGAHGNVNLTINTGAGTDTVTVAGAITVTGAVSITSQTIAVNALVTAGAASTVTLTASGAITTSGTGVDVAALSLLASAATGIDLDTNVTNLTATTSGAGDITLDEQNGANVLNVAATTGAATVTSTTGDLNVTTVSASGTATLTATSGAILDANGAANNVTAAAAAISGASGVGALADPFETTVANLEAAALTGGVFLANTGDVTIGGASAALTGIQVFISGNLVLTNAGSIFVTQVSEWIEGADDVTVSAVGATSDLQTGGLNGFFAPPAGAIGSSDGAVTLSAGRDVILGDAINNFFGDVTATNGNLSITAGRDFTLTADTLAASVGGTLTISAGRDLTLAPPGGAFGPALATTGGLIDLDAVGIVTINGGLAPSVVSGGGNIDITGAALALGDGINATLGTVTLIATTSTITDLNGVSLNVAGGLVTATAVGAIELDTEAASLTAATTNAPIVIREASAVAVNTLTAGTAMVTLLAGGAITDNNAAATNVTANSLLVTAVGGIALDTNIVQLAASNATTGNLAIVDADGLTVVTLGAVSGVANTGGNVTLTATDTAAATDHLVVNSNVSSLSGSVTLNAGDNATISANLSAATTVAINIDTGNNGGATLLVNAPVVITATAANFTGNTQADSFDFYPQATTPINVFGLAPVANPGGDTLLLHTDPPTTNPTLNILAGQGAGLYSFGNRANVQYSSIEQATTTTPIHVALDAGATGIETIRLQRSNESLPAAGNDFEVYDGANNLLYAAPINTVLSFLFTGSANANTVTIDDVNGLVDLAGTVPAPTGVGDNTNVTGTPEIFVRGNGGADALVFANGANGTDQTYGLGTGTGPGAQAGEVLTTNGATNLSVYFDGLEGVTSNDLSTPDTGALTIVGDANANAISVASDVGGTMVSATGYVPFTFGVQAFNSLTVNAGDGADTLTLASLNAGEANLAVTLNGEIGNDSLVVESAPATSTVLLQGGAGNDAYNLGGLLNTVDGILAAVTVTDSAGTDSLTLVDSADTSGDTVTITDSTINGVSLAPAPNVAFTGVEALDVTTSGGDDVITTTLNGTNGLVSVNVRGSNGDDDFFLNTADGMATLTTLNLIGDAGSDDFGSATNPIRPLIGPATNIAVYGDSTAITTNPGGGITDHLFLDMTTTSALATVNPLVIVDTVTGQATAANTRLLRFGGIDDIDLYDGGVLTDVVIGDLYVRGTALADNLIFYSEMGGVRVNHNGVVVNNALYAPTNRIVAYGRAGADYMEFNFTLGSALGADFRGEADNDTLVGGLGADTLVGGGGSDILRGGEGNDILFGEDQFLSTVANPDVQRATGVVQPGTIAGNDNLQGGGGNDILFGGGGDDVLAGGLGDDYVHGGDGNDILDSNGGNDILRGEAGADLISGATGADIILGGSGDDRIFGRGNRDFMLAGLGADQLQDDDSENDVSVSGGLSYDADNTFTQLGASITGLNDNDLALQALMFTGANAWTGAAPFATRVGAISGSFATMTNDGVMDIVIGTMAAEDYLVVNAADWQLNTLDDTIATL